MKPLACRICAAFILNKEKRREFRKNHMKRVIVNKNSYSNKTGNSDNVLLF